MVTAELTHEEEAKAILALIEKEKDFAFWPEEPYTIINDEFEEGGRWHNLEHKTVLNTENGRVFGWTARVGATEYQENEAPLDVHPLVADQPEVITFDRYVISGHGNLFARIERKAD
ncbi:MAG: hypothetical protein RR905_02815 [Aurantimicrobium sp.]